ncbi:MAG: pilus assembly protein TadG-related protein [Candidatus Binatia bacterium]
MDKNISVERNDERGAVMLLLAVALVGLIGVASLAVDIGMALVTKSELQNVADASTLAGTRELAEYYEKWPDCISQNLTTCNPATGAGLVRTKAKQYAALNKAGGVNIVVDDADVCLGNYTINSGAINCPDMDKVRLARVTARRDGTSNGVLPTQLATVLGINTMSVRTTTAAALTPIGTMKTGTGDFPIGISTTWFDTHNCGNPDPITLFPTSDTSCAGWHTFTTSPSNASRIRNQVDGIRAGTFKSPVTIAGQTKYDFLGGNAETACSNLRDLYLAKKKGNIMEANIPVYQGGCENVKGLTLIVGFAKAHIYDVKCAPKPELQVTVECGVVGEEIGTGGGANDFGFLSKVPSMVY